MYEYEIQVYTCTTIFVPSYIIPSLVLHIYIINECKIIKLIKLRLLFLTSTIKYNHVPMVLLLLHVTTRPMTNTNTYQPISHFTQT